MTESVKIYSPEIIRVCSYHRHDFDLVLIRSRPDEMQAARRCLDEPFDAPPTASLGAMTILPTELQTMILRHLDLQSFFQFRQVNRQARITATGVWEYQLVVAYGLEGLRSLLRVRLAHKLTLMHLFHLLCRIDCSICGAFGGFLFLPTATRYCFACIETSNQLAMTSVYGLAKATKVSTNRLRRTIDSIMHTIPGTYYMLTKPSKRPKDIVAVDNARRALTAQGLHGEARALELLPIAPEPSHRYMACTALPWFDRTTSKAENGLCCKGCQARLEDADGSLEDRDRVYSRAGFLTHFLQCIEAQALWDSSENGTRAAKEPNVTRLGGVSQQA